MSTLIHAYNYSELPEWLKSQLLEDEIRESINRDIKLFMGDEDVIGETFFYTTGDQEIDQKIESLISRYQGDTEKIIKSALETPSLFHFYQNNVLEYLNSVLFIFTEPGTDIEALNRGDRDIFPIPEVNPFGVQ